MRAVWDLAAAPSGEATTQEGRRGARLAVETVSQGRGAITLKLFTRAMQRELDANAHKGDWTVWLPTRRRHFYELDYHAAKLKAAVCDGDPVRVREYAADLANHAMFLCQAEGGLALSAATARDTEPSFVKPRRSVYLRLMRNPRWARKGWAGLHHPLDAEEHEDYEG